MNEVTIGGAQFREMIYAGAALLEKNQKSIDALNVFPVPDGDTGTNMTMTMQSAVKEVRALPEDATLTAVADALSMGALRGARGNSGVILSQLFRGLSKACKGAQKLDAALLAAALKRGCDAAYKAVMKPKEGTILTVSRRIADAAKEAVDNGANLYRIFDVMVESGEVALKETPELLPVLKEAGVVDSGGMGLLTIYRGFKMSLDGDDISTLVVEAPVPAQEETDPESLKEDEIKFAYRVDFSIIELSRDFDESAMETFRTHLEKLGDSVDVQRDGNAVKVHVHTNAPGKVLQMALRYGELDAITVENLLEQCRKVERERLENQKEMAYIAVSTGEGIDSLFKELSCDHIISGGQTMNPSIDSIIKAIEKVNARNVIILPNNSNIILAAQQAAKVAKVKVEVLNTKTIPQGIAAAMAYDPDASLADNRDNMTSAFQEVKSGSVTYAVRTTKWNGESINEGDILGMREGAVCAVGTDIGEVLERVIRSMMEDAGSSDGTLTLLYGSDVSEETANQLASHLESVFPSACIIMQSGGQPLYYYYVKLDI